MTTLLKLLAFFNTGDNANIVRKIGTGITATLAVLGTIYAAIPKIIQFLQAVLAALGGAPAA